MRISVRVANILSKIVRALFVAIVLGILLDIFIFSDTAQYTWKRDFLLSNRINLVIALGLALVISVLLGFKTLHVGSQKVNITLIIFLLSFLLLILQIWIAYHIYFYTNWDVNVIRSMAVDRAAIQQPLSEDSYYFSYFSVYPNNTNLGFIFWIIRKVWLIFGQGRYFIWVAVSCLLVNLAGVFTYLTSYAITKRVRYSVIAWLLFTLLVSLSPWITIPYSDTYGILFPILALYLYVTKKPRQHQFLRWFLIGFLCIFGYTLKPTTLIVLIAIVLNEGINFLRKGGALKVKTLLFSFMGVILALFSVLLINRLAESLLFGDLDDEQKITFVHYVMMGLNPETHGTWSAEDNIFSQSFPSQSEQNAGNYGEIQKRLQDFGFWGYLKFLGKKALVNFADGSFAWSYEGDFYYQLVERQKPVSAFLREIFYDGGQFHTIFLSVVQVLWLTVLAFSLFAGLYWKQQDDTLLVPLLSVIGLVLFVMIFEARARYLYSFMPVIIIGAGLGARNAGCLIQRVLPKIKN